MMCQEFSLHDANGALKHALADVAKPREKSEDPQAAPKHIQERTVSFSHF